MDQNNQGSNTTPESIDLAKQYQDILDRYSKELASVPSEAPTEVTTNISPVTASVPEPPQILIEPAPIPEPIIETPVEPTPTPEVKPLPLEPVSESIVPTSPVTIPAAPSSNLIPVFDPPLVVTPPKKNNFFKILFLISLLIFVGVAAAIGYTLYSRGMLPFISKAPVADTSPAPKIDSTKVCELNDKQYQIGEGFPSADGCNSCSCSSDLTIVCTEKACAPTVIPVATVSSTMKTFSNKVLGINLRYPDNYGTVDISFPKPQSVGKFTGSFSRNLLITLAGFDGYTNSSGQVTIKPGVKTVVPQPIAKENIIEIYTNKAGVESIIVNNFDGTKTNTNVLVNLPTTTYPGLNIAFDKLVTLAEIKSFVDGVSLNAK